MTSLSSIHCDNCGSDLGETFCGMCGQLQRSRLTLISLFKDGFQRVFDTEQGFLRTLRTLVRYPGRPQRDYIDSKRRRYVNPITFYLVGATAQLLSLYFVGALLAQSVGAGLLEESIAALQASGIENHRVWVGERYLLLIQNAYTWLGVITFVLPMAVMLKLLLPKRINLAEALVYSFYTIAFVMLVTALVAPFSVQFSQAGHGIFSISLYFVYALFSATGCFGFKLWPIVAGFLSMLVGSICFFAALAVGSQVMFNPNFFI